MLLIAVAIQGTTPDPDDVSSMNALRLLCPIVGDLGSGVSHDGFPDEVCEPMRPGALVDAAQISRVQHDETCPLEPAAPAVAASGIRRLLAGVESPRPDESAHLSCRLTC
jgi:hypothetical protein